VKHRIIAHSIRTRNIKIAVTVAALLVPAAHAQQSSTVRANENEHAVLAEIVVTAQKREQSLEDVPIAVTALSGDDLISQQIDNLGGLQARVPNLSLSVGDSMNAVAFIRGVGQRENIAFADPGVGIYVDDVYLGRAQGAFLNVLDVDRIEVLRGPQGTLYGRNTIGGAIRYVSAKPTNEPSGWAEVTAGNFDRRDFKASISGPLADGLSGRLAVARLTEDGYTRNLYDGSRLGDEKTQAWRGTLRDQLGESFELELTVDGSREHPHSGRPPVLLQAGLFSPGTVFGEPYTTSVNFDNLANLDTDGASVTATWRPTSALSLKSITAYRRMRWDYRLDTDATPLATFDVFVQPEHQHQWSQELQLNYAAGPVTAVGGLYYFQEHDVTVQGVFAPDFAGGLGFYEVDRNDQVNWSNAAYTQLDWKVNDALSATLGVRYTWERKDFRRTQDLFGDVNLNGNPLTPLPTSVADLIASMGHGIRVTDLDIPHTTPFDNKWSDVSPKAGLNWNFAEHALAYVSATKGFKSGGFYGRANASFDATPYQPEKLWSYEAGIKSTELDGRLRLNGAIFYNDYKDMQVTSFSARNGSLVTTFDNAGKSTLKGAELEAAYVFNKRLTVDADLSFLDARFDEYFIHDASGARIDVANQRKLPFTPKWTGHVGGSLRLLHSSYGDLNLRADWSYRAKTYFEITGSEVLAQSGYGLIDSALMYTSVDGHWTVRVAGQNLADKVYRNFGFNLIGSGLGQFAYYGAPRTYSVALRYSL
jgi:iron complex outermembrane receptor protein